MTALVDANVLLDVLAERKPFHVASEEVWSRVESGRVNGLVCAVSLAHIYYLARKQVGSARALEAVRRISAVFRIAAVDERVIGDALASGMRDWEDAMQAFSGLRAGATHVVTRDPAGFAGGPLIVLSPDELTARADTLP